MEKPVHLGKENPQEKHLYLRRTGRYTQKRDTSGVCIYTYNTKNQQTSVQLEDGTVQTNRYDPEGLRHEMEENGKLLRFVYHKGELVYERGEKEQTSYHQGAGTEALNRAGKIYYYHKDEQLSTALITDETGTVSNCYRYDAFGNILDSMEQIENRIRYTGQQYDGITGQYYLRTRYYNPAVGRFMQEDTYRGDGLNLYAYCANNPVTYYDPSGYAGTSSYVAADGGDGGEGNINFPENESQLKHIFRNKEGHFLDTSENRETVLDVANNRDNYLGVDSRGNDWYARIESDGSQTWVRVRNNVIDNAGSNTTPRTWDSETGLYNNIKK